MQSPAKRPWRVLTSTPRILLPRRGGGFRLKNGIMRAGRRAARLKVGVVMTRRAEGGGQERPRTGMSCSSGELSGGCPFGPGRLELSGFSTHRTVRMNIHENARLAPLRREEMARSSAKAVFSRPRRRRSTACRRRLWRGGSSATSAMDAPAWRTARCGRAACRARPEGLSSSAPLSQRRPLAPSVGAMAPATDRKPSPGLAVTSVSSTGSAVRQLSLLRFATPAGAQVC